MTMTLARAVAGLALGGLLAGCAPAVAAQNDPGSVSAQPARLSVSGTQILDPRGRQIILRGYNWGQWGTAQPQDAADNVAQGANSVRIPLRWWGDWKDEVDSRDPGAPGHIDRDHLALLDQTIAWATDHQLWVTLFVDSNYGQGAGGRTDNFWTNPAMKQEFVEVWQFLVHRYQRTPYIGAFEILPEPNPAGVDDAGVRAFYDSIIPVIRGIDRRTPIVVGPNDGYNLNHLEGAYTTVDPNIIYTGNYFIFDNPLSRIADITSFEQQFNAPVWINQVGILSGRPDSLEKAHTVLDAFDDNGIGWAWWTYRVASTNPDNHGIYYQDPADPTRWLVKPEWLALVTSFLHRG
ncbi:glycoside hydrolase family 5 protein [Actinophytocola sp.]|uniref:glycoside hydrolase family 5 protein n=1 Tax=Actinophytocola sp. TaxID=1872138 RepID=UPI002D7F9211|nr:cellulase family glycosylhydrolase [Actinophytocola sp.]HET9137909.1 cellulase family glycosylhydrolase [Actinophytocola sp.]